MQWTRGKFLENGGCGYVLKPEFMRNLNSPEEVGTRLNRLKPLKINIKVNMVSLMKVKLEYTSFNTVTKCR